MMNSKESRIYGGEGTPLNNPYLYVTTGKNLTPSIQNGIPCITTDRLHVVNQLKYNTCNRKTSKKMQCFYALHMCTSLIGLAIACSSTMFFWTQMELLKKEILHLKNQTNQMIENPVPSRLHSIYRSQENTNNYTEITTHKPLNQFKSNKFDDENSIETDEVILKLDKQFSKALPRTGLLVAHYNGVAGEVNLGHESEIGPWDLDPRVSSIDCGRAFNLADTGRCKNKCVYVKEEGLYLVYAQMTYLTNAASTFHMFSRQLKDRNANRLFTCSTGDISQNAQQHTMMTCSAYTVARLSPGEVINLAQKQHNRTVWLDQGRSYFGFVKISS